MRGTLEVCLLLFALTLASCSQSKSSPSISQDIPITQKSSGCLDLEKITNHMSQEGFRVSATVYTKSLEVLDEPNHPELAKKIVLNSISQQKRSVHSLPNLENVTQNECTSVGIPDVSGQLYLYRVVSYTYDSLSFVLDREHQKTLANVFPPSQRESIINFPIIHTMTVRALNNRAVEILSHYSTVPTNCFNNQSAMVREKRVYDWSNDVKLNLDANYLRKLHEIAEVSYEEGTQPETVISSETFENLVTALRAKSRGTCP